MKNPIAHMMINDDNLVMHDIQETVDPSLDAQNMYSWDWFSFPQRFAPYDGPWNHEQKDPTNYQVTVAECSNYTIVFIGDHLFAYAEGTNPSLQRAVHFESFIDFHHLIDYDLKRFPEYQLT